MCHMEQHFFKPDLVLYPMLKKSSRLCIDQCTFFLAERKTELRIEDFPFVIQPAFCKTFADEPCKLALKQAGILPLNPDIVVQRFPNAKSWQVWKQIFAGTVTNSPTSTTITTTTTATTTNTTTTPSDITVSNNVWRRPVSMPLHNRSPKHGVLPELQKRLSQHPGKICYLPASSLDFNNEQKDSIWRLHFSAASETNL